MGKMLGKSIHPKCKYCKFSVALEGDGSLLCPHKGVVDADDFCKKYKYDVLKRKPQTPPPPPIEFSDDDFTLE